MSEAIKERTDKEVAQLQKRRKKRHNLEFFNYQIKRHDITKVNILDIPDNIDVTGYKKSDEMGDSWIIPTVTDLHKIINHLSKSARGLFMCIDNTFYIG